MKTHIPLLAATLAFTTPALADNPIGWSRQHVSTATAVVSCPDGFKETENGKGCVQDQPAGATNLTSQVKQEETTERFTQLIEHTSPCGAPNVIHMIVGHQNIERLDQTEMFGSDALFLTINCRGNAWMQTGPAAARGTLTYELKLSEMKDGWHISIGDWRFDPMNPQGFPAVINGLPADLIPYACVDPARLPASMQRACRR